MADCALACPGHPFWTVWLGIVVLANKQYTLLNYLVKRFLMFIFMFIDLKKIHREQSSQAGSLIHIRESFEVT